MRSTAILFILLCGISSPLFAQVTPELPPDRTVRKDSSARYEILRGAVGDTGEAYRRQRRSDAWNNTAGGILSSAIGGYLFYVATQNDDLFLTTLGITAIGLGVRDLVSGIFNFAFPYAQEPITEKLLSDRDLLLSSGLLFLEQEALAAKRRRIVGGTMSILNAGTYGLMYFPLSNYAGDEATILAIFLAVGAGLELVGGILTLVGKSGPERVYERTKAQLQFQESDAPKRLTIDWGPLLHKDDRAFVGGMSFIGRF